MKEHIETAPVIEAVQQHETCPICQLRNMIEQQTVERYLGGAVMEPDIRIRTNEVGFCRTHHQLLMAQKDFHGYALMMQTRLRYAIQKVSPAIRGLSKGHGWRNKQLASARHEIGSCIGHCLICDGTAKTIERYATVFFKLYREDSTFRSEFAKSAGFCLPDMEMMLEKAAGALSGAALQSFLETVSTQADQVFGTTQADIDALCSSFHFGSEEKNNPRIHQALERSVNLLRGKTF